MAYRKIPNLYKDQRILEFKEVYSLEKIHGTSTHISWKDGNLSFYSGGIQPHEDFVALFDTSRLASTLQELGHSNITVYGEGYGGKCQKMRDTYGEGYKFCAFEVKIGDYWLDVPNAYDVAHEQLGLDFVAYKRVIADIDVLDEERRAPSIQSQKCGCGEKLREGIVLRPPFEVTLNNGDRLLAKHKNKEFQERENQPSPKDIDPDKIERMKESQTIADEWVNEMRLAHVLDQIRSASLVDNLTIEDTGKVIHMMTKDIFTEAESEIEGDEKAIKKAIGSKTAEVYHRWLESTLER